MTGVTYQVFSERWVAVIHTALFGVDAELVTQRGPAGRHAHWGFGCHSTLRGHALWSVTGGSG